MEYADALAEAGSGKTCATAASMLAELMNNTSAPVVDRETEGVCGSQKAATALPSSLRTTRMTFA